jgi:hypothetical protein
MPNSIAYDSTVDDMAKGTIAFATDSFKVLLVTAAYTPDKAAHARRSDITGEVIGAGYTAGGAAAGVIVTTDLVEHHTDIALGGASWPTSTITAAGAVYYDSRGGPPEDDELVAYIDFGGDIISVSGNFALEPSTVRIQN